MKKEHTVSFGARILHENEIKLSLPTYQKLKEQIEEVRKNAQRYVNNHNEKDEFTYPQVINNFAILGSRGTGKSSILKTLYEYLKKENGSEIDLKEIKNILLPTIVPENLVSHVSLMGCLLGLFKQPVNQICENQKNKNSLCPPEKYFIEKEYRALMEEFVRLQQPYEQISVREFSTDSEYVRTMTAIFEAGNQFTIKFRNFIDQLLAEYSQNAMLFIFIDDIDLSTNRCSDIVKTLLSYLSHPRIVTILAGDITVFGEALTLDFLRQEQIPDTKFMEKSYLFEMSQYDGKEQEDLLKRKKQLAYEYLKKIMPPNNRHNILYWTLSMRGDFGSIGTNPDEDTRITLTDLLVQLDSYVPLLNHYFLDKNNNSKTNNRKSDVLLYCFFDSTARGLVSSYHAIYQLLEKLEKENITSYEHYASVKFTIESIVASNYTLSKFQDIIFNQFIELGVDLDSSSVKFDNFNVWLLKEITLLQAFEPNDVQDKQVVQVDKNIKIDIEMEKIAFQIFCFLDWSCRLFKKEEMIDKDEQYNQAKRRVLFLLCANGFINEKNMNLDISQREKIYPTKFNDDNSNNNYNYYYYTYNNANIILSTYYKLPFPIAVRYFQTFDVKRLVALLNCNSTEKENIVFAIDFVKTLKDFYGDDENSIAQYLIDNKNMNEFIDKFLKQDQKNILLSVILSKYFHQPSNLYQCYCLSGVLKQNNELNFDLNVNCEDYIDFVLKGNNKFNNELEAQIKEYNNKLKEKFKNCADINTIESESNNCEETTAKYYALAFKKICYENLITLFDGSGNDNYAIPFLNAYGQSIEIWEEQEGKCRIKKLARQKYDSDDSRIKDNEQMNIICAIDEKNLWNMDSQNHEEERYIKKIIEYVEHKINEIETQIVNSNNGIMLSEDFKSAFNEFEKSNDGVGNTLASKCKNILKSLFATKCIMEKKEVANSQVANNEGLNNQISDNKAANDVSTKNECTITTLEYIASIQILNRLIYSTAWYGKNEARAVKKQLEKCVYSIFKNLKQDKLKEYTFWFHCYCRYQIAKHNDDLYSIIKEAEESANIVQRALDSYHNAMQKQYIEDFAKNVGIKEEIIHEIPEIFSINKKKEGGNDDKSANQ